MKAVSLNVTKRFRQTATMGTQQDISRGEHIEDAEARKVNTLDLEDDPHRAALEDNPEVAEKPSWSTCLAVFVRTL
jgi:hypothetical protein